MDIQHKREHKRIAYDVDRCRWGTMQGWVKKLSILRDVDGFYSDVNWEPLEEWVDVQMNKHDYEERSRYSTMNRIMHCDGIRFKLP